MGFYQSFVFFPPFWCCFLSCFCSNFVGFPNHLPFSPSPLLVFVVPFGFLSPPFWFPSLPLVWSSSPSLLAHPLRFLPMCFPSYRVFTSLAVSLSVLRSLVSSRLVSSRLVSSRLVSVSSRPVRSGLGWGPVWGWLGRVWVFGSLRLYVFGVFR